METLRWRGMAPVDGGFGTTALRLDDVAVGVLWPGEDEYDALASRRSRWP